MPPPPTLFLAVMNCWCMKATWRCLLRRRWPHWGCRQRSSIPSVCWVTSIARPPGSTKATWAAQGVYRAPQVLQVARVLRVLQVLRVRLEPWKQQSLCACRMNLLYRVCPTCPAPASLFASCVRCLARWTKRCCRWRGGHSRSATGRARTGFAAPAPRPRCTWPVSAV